MAKTYFKGETLKTTVEDLVNDGIDKAKAEAAVAIVRKYWDIIYDQGGIHPSLREEIDETGVEFDHINNIVQTLLG